MTFYCEEKETVSLNITRWFNLQYNPL